MSDDSEKPVPIVTSRQLMAAIAALALHAGINGAVPLLSPHGPDEATERAVVRIGDELANIRASLVSTQIDMTKALATAMQELADHSRRLEQLEYHRSR